MQTRIDGWTPYEGHVDVAMLEEVGRENAATNALALEVINQAYAGFGETAFQLPARLEVAATLNVDLTVTALLTPLLAGGRVRLVDGLEEVPAAADVSFMKVTPTHLALLRSRPDLAPSTLVVVLGA